MHTNLFGPWRLMQALLPLLRESAHPRVVNVASGAGSHGDQQFGLTRRAGAAATYGISKAALTRSRVRSPPSSRHAGPIGPRGPTGATGPTGPAGPQGPQGVGIAAGSCPSGQSVTGVDSSGHIICNSGCPATTLTFHITSVSTATLENWPGGTQTMTSGPSCSLTVMAPSGVISSGGDAWSIVSKTGWVNASGTVQQPTCGGVGAVASVSNNRPLCSNASTVGESGNSTDNFVVSVS